MKYITLYYAIRRACRKTADQLGIDPTSVFVLMLAVELNSPLTTDLYAISLVDGAAIRTATYELEAKGLVTRKSADGTPPRAGVAVRITPTAQGHTIAHLTAELIESVMNTSQDTINHAADLEEAQA